jgi:FixJ family two-component response regulator
MLECAKNNKIFIIDDDSAVCDAIKQILAGAKYNVSCFTSSDAALTAVHREHFDVLISDIKLADTDGVKLIGAIHALKSHVPILAITGFGSVALAVNTIKQGAVHFMEKPLDRAELLLVVKKLSDEFFERHKHWHQMFTDSEIAVFELLMVGKSTKEIAKIQYRSPRTIEHHREKIKTKCGDRYPLFINV